MSCSFPLPARCKGACPPYAISSEQAHEGEFRAIAPAVDCLGVGIALFADEGKGRGRSPGARAIGLDTRSGCCSCSCFAPQPRA